MFCWAIECIIVDIEGTEVESDQCPPSHGIFSSYSDADFHWAQRGLMYIVPTLVGRQLQFDEGEKCLMGFAVSR